MTGFPPTLIGVIADDLTGANDTGILLRHLGLRTASVTALDWPREGLLAYRCVCINTQSRALPPQAASQRVREAARLILEHGGQPVAKRIDSTLRGNLGAELEAVLATLGPDALAVVTGAFPRSGRATIDGYHYVHGVLLADTPVRNDPLCPVTESHVPTLLASQTRLKIGQLLLTEVRRGVDAVAEALRDHCAQGCKLVCADAETDADIAVLGAGMAQSGLTCVAADPGPLTAVYVAAVMPPRRQRVMVVAGSISTLTREQLDRLESDTGTALVAVDGETLSASPLQAQGEVERVIEILSSLPSEAPVVGVRAGNSATVRGRRAAEIIAAGFAEIAAWALQQIPGIAGLYTTGGDITLAVCQRLEARAIELTDEVMPLAVAGRLIGGRCSGLPVVTKGGLVGDRDAAIACVRHLQHMMGEEQ